MKDCSFTSEKGTVTLYFLSAFAMITAFVSVIALNMKFRMNAMANMMEVHRFLDQENAVICELRCLLINEQDIGGEYSRGEAVFSLSGGPAVYTAHIFYPLEETLYIQLMDDSVFDYSYQR